ncbi:dihydrolipoyl dehydrogenase family protein [Nocardioides campestrisoli]|uniref:dihydrolipoyl dehydrogenase family protein n=1 Tax=Nocardioides campestrisoli TaxID=2736757 RepID=UPI00163D8712|nr:NAD(P)/FAD-dependent oxidoreductase [Nocardioides campestrisoli]
MTDDAYDAVVIGMGPGGEVAATRLLQAGKRVAVVERELIGGECGYWACIPSKTLLRPVELALQAAAAPGVTTPPLDWEAARQWRDAMVRHLDDAKQVAGYEDQGATVVRGEARIAGPGVVEVDGRRLVTQHVIVATGSRSVVPEIEGLDECTVWTNREATGFEQVPGRVVVIGASAVAVEVAQYLAGYGAQVTLVGRGPRLLRREEPRVGELAAEHLRARGIDLRLGAGPVRAFKDGADSSLVLDDGSVLTADVLVLATGRRPRTEGLGLEELEVTLDGHGALAVDEHCHAGAGVWGVGDVTGTAMFTHVAKYQARIATAAILGRPRTARYDSVPRVVFGHPEIAAVGMTEEQAVAGGRRVRTSQVDLTAALARPWTYEEEPTGAWLGLVADADTDLLVGAWAVAPQASEWIHQAALAIGAAIPIDRLLDHVPQFPTYSEGFVPALEGLLD